MKDGKTVNTYFLYDGSNVIMEADEKGVTAKNTYGGPLLLRTVFDDTGEETYQYLYNAHGDVVTLLSEGDVVATYYYDSFGNILEQTGEVDNSILYAGYQYDEETGLYYINARMYDPVTARFLQVDTYPGNQNDPLSLNFYTYCLNNPHKYVDPSGHFAITITAATVLLIVRISAALISGIVSAKGEYDRQVEEGDNYTNWGSVIFVGIANAGISFLTFGMGQGAAAVAGTGAKAVLKHIGKAVVRDVALGAITDASVETARQLVTGTKITNLEYDRIAEAGVYGGIAGGASSLAGAGLESFMQTRVAQKALVKLNEMANKGADAIQNAFRKVAKKSGTTVGLEDITGKKEPMFKMNLQFFASDEVYQSGTSSLNEEAFTRYLANGKKITDITELPGSTGISIPKRLSTEEMTFLTQEYGVEFAQVYKYGNGINGSGGHYKLYSGTVDSVQVPIANDIMLINHTHPGGTAYPSNADKLLLRRYQQLGSLQRSSEIIPIGRNNVRFNVNGLIGD